MVKGGRRALVAGVPREFEGPLRAGGQWPGGETASHEAAGRERYRDKAYMTSRIGHIGFRKRFAAFLGSIPVYSTPTQKGATEPFPSFLSTPVHSRRLLAMQKVEGSSPFIRFAEPAGNGGFFYAASSCSGVRERL